MQEITVTPLEAMGQLIMAANLIDTAECKDEEIYNRLQGAISVAETVLKQEIDALAMAPKQEAPAESLPEMTDERIFEWAEGYVFTLKGMPHKMTFSRPRFVEAVRTIIAHLSASVAAPAAANGAPGYAEKASPIAITDSSALNGIKWYVPPPEHLRNGMQLYFVAPQPVSAAGPDAALVSLIHKAQMILAHHLPPDGPDAKTTISELLGLLDGPESRAALSGAKGN